LSIYLISIFVAFCGQFCTFQAHLFHSYFYYLDDILRKKFNGDGCGAGVLERDNGGTRIGKSYNKKPLSFLQRRGL